MALLNNIAASRRNFSPLSLAPALWLSDTGSDPAQWDDISGNNRHATQATVENQPEIVTNALNGRQVRSFNGTSDRMLHGLTGNIASCSIFAVFKMLSTQSGYRGIIAIGPSGVNGSMLLSRVNSSKWGTYTGSNAPSNSDVSSTQFKIHCIIDNSGAGGLFYLNGLADGFYTGNSHGQTAAHVGGDPSVSQWSNCDIAEILVFPTALSPEDRRKVEKYLSDKWAITIPTVDEFYVQSLAPALWLDASDPNTLFDAVSGGNLVGADGTVARWEDKSGNARHATQSTLANRPLRKLAEMGGKDALYFDGGDGIVVPAFTNTGTFTIFSVWKASAGSMVYEWGTTFNTLGDVYFTAGTGATFSHWSTTSPTNIYSARDGTSPSWAKDNTPRIITHYGDGTHAGHNARVNGVLPNWTVAKSDDPGTTSRSNPFNIGSRNNAGSLWITGHIAEIIIVPSKLSNTVYQNIEKYLSNKWNVPVYDPDAENYFARITAAGSSITDQNKLAVDAFIKGCKADNNWFAIKACCLLAGADTLSGALVPLVGPIPTNTLFTEPDYSRINGLQGGPTLKYLTSNRSNASDPQNDCSLAIWVTKLPTNGLTVASSTNQNGAGGRNIFAPTTVRYTSMCNNGGNNATTAHSTLMTLGFVGISRTEEARHLFRTGGVTDIVNKAVTAPEGSVIRIFGQGNNATPFSDARISFYSIGTSINLERLDARLATYMSSLN